MPNTTNATRLRWYARLQEILGEYAATNVTSTVILFGLLWLIWQLAKNIAGAATDPSVATANKLLVVFGVLCGWIAGLFASPFSHEKDEFAELKKAIYAFLTGYLVSKLDRFLESTLFIDDQAPAISAWGQAMLFACAFLAAALITFIWRRYGFRGPDTTQTDERAPVL